MIEAISLNQDIVFRIRPPLGRFRNTDRIKTPKQCIPSSTLQKPFKRWNRNRSNKNGTKQNMTIGTTQQGKKKKRKVTIGP